MKNKGQTGGIIILGIVMLIVIGGWSIVNVGIIMPTKGQHTGTISAYEHNDYIWTSANLVYFKTSRESTQEDVYCINDPAVIEQVKQFQQNSTVVTILYKNDWWTPKSVCDGGISVIYKVVEE